VNNLWNAALTFQREIEREREGKRTVKKAGIFLI